MVELLKVLLNPGFELKKKCLSLIKETGYNDYIECTVA